MNLHEEFLDAREKQAKTLRPAGEHGHTLPPEERLLNFDRWVRAQLATRIDWTWAGSQKERRIEQCRIHLESLVLDLWRRGWMLDGKKLARHIEALLDAVAKQQKAGGVRDFWIYFSACVNRYVGANAEELREEAMRAGTHVGQLLNVLGVKAGPAAPTLPELVAQRAGEITTAKTLREKLAEARARGKRDSEQSTLEIG